VSGFALVFSSEESVALRGAGVSADELLDWDPVAARADAPPELPKLSMKKKW
jgi:hypothetical protein